LPAARLVLAENMRQRVAEQLESNGALRLQRRRKHGAADSVPYNDDD
jgi:hypothetical protein